ncbi:MAG: hypothetical protein IT430_09100 [Phycisphaerales bacterium]|nr:hypothetical protein [Phycisphaerales bacterium]
MRKRLRSTIKWGGAVLTVLLLVVWVGSAWWQAGVRSHGFYLEVYGGGLSIGVDRWRDDEFEFWLKDHTFDVWWWFDVTVRPDPFAEVIGYIPIWFLLLATGLASGWLWHRDRRRALCLCIKCGYDLRGNASGVCPECGTPPPRPSPALRLGSGQAEPEEGVESATT